MTITHVRDLDSRLGELRKLRGEIALEDESLRGSVDATLAAASELRNKGYESCVMRAGEELQGAFSRIEAGIDAARSTDEVYGVLAGDDYAAFVDLVSFLDSAEERKRWHDAVDSKVEARLGEIEREAQRLAARAAERSREAADAVARLVTKLSDAAGKVTGAADLKALQAGSLMAALTKAAAQLPPEDQNMTQSSIATIIQKAGQRAAVGATKGKVQAAGGAIVVGKERFSVAGEYSPMVRRLAEHEGTSLADGKLAFEDGFGRTYVSPASLGGLAAGSEERVEVERRAFSEAVSHFRALGRRVPQLRSSWVMTKHTEECLERIVRELNIQRESGQGILILEGEAGTGKNVLIDILANFSLHERYMFACNYQTQKEDFTYDYAFTPERGTYRVSAKLLEKLSTPYVINAFDEINTLPPGVLKMLNALLDERRTLFLADGREVPMDPTSLLVGFMNPRSYVGTQELSREVVSRASIITIGYPPLRRANAQGAELFAPDEALMLAVNTPGLSHFSQPEFESIWDEVVNKKGASTVSVTGDQRRLVQGLHRVIKVANAVRQQYEAYQTNVGTQQMDFVFCLRTTSSIARRLRPDVDPLQVIEEVVLPKVSDPETRKNVKLLVSTT